MYAYARRRTGPDAAEDVVADTFAIAWRRLDSVPEPALPWLLGTARRVLANRARSEQRRSRLFGRLRQQSLIAPNEISVAETGLIGDVLAALRRLPDRQREAVTLVAWDGLSGAEAAAVAGCSRAAFAVRLHRARRRLRNDLAASAHESSEGAQPSGSSAPIREVPRS